MLVNERVLVCCATDNPDKIPAFAGTTKVCGLCAHGVGRVGLTLRAEYGGAIEKTWRLLII